MKIAIYPGTFDPITNGHIDLIYRSARLFEHIIIGVAASTRKKTFFSLEERLSLCQDILADLSQVKIYPFEGLLVDFAKQQQADIIIRGLRAVSDFDFEFQLASMNHHMSPELETIFLPAMSDKAYISASLVREVVSLGGDVSEFVHPLVIEYFRKKTRFDNGVKNY